MKILFSILMLVFIFLNLSLGFPPRRDAWANPLFFPFLFFSFGFLPFQSLIPSPAFLYWSTPTTDHFPLHYDARFLVTVLNSLEFRINFALLPTLELAPHLWVISIYVSLALFYPVSSSYVRLFLSLRVSRGLFAMRTSLPSFFSDFLCLERVTSAPAFLLVPDTFFAHVRPLSPPFVRQCSIQ